MRKGQELLVARWLEEDLGKRRILELYLNVIEWGHGIYGCQAAALRYYGKPCSDLGPDEAAGMAAMIPNPRRINPAINPARHARAQRRVLWLMGNAGYLGRRDLGAEPPPVDTGEDEDESAEDVAPAEPAEGAPAPTPAPGEPSPSVEPLPSPDAVPTPETPPPTEPSPTPTLAAGTAS